ncbi:MAG: hypothetical protein IJ703_00230 [Eubacterium sp.]|nr:hypothetical protein [Eubacterium sp.]
MSGTSLSGVSLSGALLSETLFHRSIYSWLCEISSYAIDEYSSTDSSISLFSALSPKNPLSISISPPTSF